MATQVLTDVKLYTGEYDLSGDMSAIALNYTAELVDDTVFGDDTRSRAGGLKNVSLSAEGFWNGGTGAVDDVLFDNIGVADVPVTVVPGGETLANPCYLFRAIHGNYTPGASIGEMLRFSVSAEGSGGVGVVRGNLLHVGSETATGAEDKQELGAVLATQSIYASLHVLTVSGTNPTLDVLLESDADGSAGGETTRITFTQATAATSEWKSLAGAVTDTYWRASWTIGGTDTPTFEFIVSVGIK
jgi:hypothetical protein